MAIDIMNTFQQDMAGAYEKLENDMASVASLCQLQTQRLHGRQHYAIRLQQSRVYAGA